MSFRFIRCRLQDPHAKTTSDNMVVPMLPAPPQFIEHDLSQSKLLSRVNEYLKAKQYQTLSEEGCCHGLTLNWLAHMANKNVERFYQTNKKIISLSAEKLLEMSAEMNEFIVRCYFAQYPKEWLPWLDQDNVDLILSVNEQVYLNQIYLSNLLTMIETYKTQLNTFTNIQQVVGEKQLVLDGYYSTNELIELLRLYSVDGNKICISTGLEAGLMKRHTIGVFVETGIYHAYDANDKSGRAKKFEFAEDVEKWVRVCIYQNFGFVSPVLMQLAIKIVRAPFLHVEMQAQEENCDYMGLFSNFISYLAAPVISSSDHDEVEFDIESQCPLIKKKK